MSDPFMMGFPEISKMSLKIIRKLNDHGIKMTSLTKGKYPKNILDYGKNEKNEYGISLVAADSDFVKFYEPNAQKWHLRIANLRKLHHNGVRTWVSIEPFPTPNIFNQNLTELLERVSFVDKIIFGRWNYNKNSSSYDDHRQFYNECSLLVAEYCNRYGIDYHIKEGTLTLPTIIVEKRSAKVAS
jgi:DNA repair photolyase